MDNYENLLNLAHDAIMVLDLSNSAIVFWNRGAVELYGWTRESMSPSVPRGSPCSLLLTIDEACSRTNAAPGVLDLQSRLTEAYDYLGQCIDLYEGQGAFDQLQQAPQYIECVGTNLAWVYGLHNSHMGV